MRLNVVVSRTEGSELSVAQCVEVDIASQGTTVDEALANVQEALELYFEGEDDVPAPTPAIAELRSVEISLAS